MKKSALFLAVAGAILGVSPSAFAHSYYNLSGSGSVASGNSAIGFGIANSINGTDGISNRPANNTNVFNPANPGLNNLIPGTGTAAPNVVNGSSPAGTLPELGGTLPYMWYSGQHTTAAGYTKRAMYTGSSATDNTSPLFQNLPTLPNGVVLPGTAADWGTATLPATANPGGLWRAYDQKNGGANAATWGTIMADLPGGTGDADHPFQAVAGNSWSTGQGLDYGLIHISCGANTAGENCASAGDVLATITIANDSDYPQYNGLLDVALYRATDTSATADRNSGANIGGANPQGSNLGAPIWAASMSSVSDILYYSFIFNQAEWLATDKDGGDGIHEHGFYTLFVGAHGGGSTDGVTYSVLVTTSPVPVPAAVWLFGSALAGMGVIGRRKQAASV